MAHKKNDRKIADDFIVRGHQRFIHQPAELLEVQIIYKRHAAMGGQCGRGDPIGLVHVAEQRYAEEEPQIAKQQHRKKQDGR